jgi:hypothetical protein
MLVSKQHLCLNHPQRVARDCKKSEKTRRPPTMLKSSNPSISIK